MRKINFTKRELKAINQIEAYRKLMDISIKKENPELLAFASNQYRQWCDQLYDSQVAWLENETAK